MRLNLFTPFFDLSGYANVGRNLYGSLKDSFEIKLITNLIPGWEAHCSLELRKAIERQFNGTGAAIFNTFPDRSGEWFGERFNPLLQYCIFEGDKIPYHWAYYLNQPEIKYVLCPSKHVIKACRNTKVKPSKLKLIPHGVDNTIFNPTVKKISQLEDGYFKFLYVGGWAQGREDRKGVDILLEAFCEEFKPIEKVELILKINTVYNRQDWNIYDEIKKLNLPSCKRRPKIRIILDNLPAPNLASLYKSCNCFVMPTKAEAFCLPCAEALACGIPVITTNFGGQTDFVNKKNGWLIDIEEMIPASDNFFNIYEGIRWAKPSKEHLKKLMRYAFEHKLETEAKGISASKEILLEYSWEAVSYTHLTLPTN